MNTVSRYEELYERMHSLVKEWNIDVGKLEQALDVTRVITDDDYQRHARAHRTTQNLAGIS